MRDVVGCGSLSPVAPSIFTPTTTHLPHHEPEDINIAQTCHEVISGLLQLFNLENALRIDLFLSERPSAGFSDAKRSIFQTRRKRTNLVSTESSESQDYHAIIFELDINGSQGETSVSSFLFLDLIPDRCAKRAKELPRANQTSQNLASNSPNSPSEEKVYKFVHLLPDSVSFSLHTHSSLDPFPFPEATTLLQLIASTTLTAREH